MKKVVITTLIALLGWAMLFGQVPQGFNYQGVVRDSSGVEIKNQLIGLRLSILKDNPASNPVYTETFISVTDQFGIYNEDIGHGYPVKGSFSSIDWSTGTYFVKTEIDITGGTNYQLMGTSQFLSVPYALYSQNSANGSSQWTTSGNDIYYNNGNVGIGTMSTAGKLEISKQGVGIGWSSPFLKMTNTAATSGKGWEFYVGDNGANGDNDFMLSRRTISTLDNYFIIKDNGNIGMGTNNPNSNYKLDVKGNIITSGDSFELATNNIQALGAGRDLKISHGGNGYGDIIFSTQQGTERMRISNLGEVNTSCNVKMGSYNGTSSIKIGVSSANPAYSIGFGKWHENDIFEQYMVFKDGRFGINTDNPSYTLSVAGTIQSYEVIVNTGWSDFVFEKDYKLMPLNKLEKYIKENKHLPEIPTAKEVETNGVKVGDNQAKLLQKIEELTLYMIDLKKENDALKVRLKKIENKIK